MELLETYEITRKTGDSACSNNCNNHGYCHDGSCFCMRFWSGDHCEQSLMHQTGYTAWNALVGLVCGIQASVLLLIIYQFIRRVVTVRQRQAKFTFTFRDASALCNALGSVTRIIWFIQVSLPQDVLIGRVFEQVLLRLPQLFWIASYLCLVLVWADIMAAVRNERVSIKLRRAVIFSIVVLGLVTIPLAITQSVLHDKHIIFILAGISNCFLAVYVAFLEVGGLKTLLRARNMLRVLHEYEAATRVDGTSAVVPVYRMAMRTCIGLVLSVILGLILFVMVIILIATGVDPTSHPEEYLIFLFVVHIAVEGGASVTILFTTWQSDLRRSKRTNKQNNAKKSKTSKRLKGPRQGATVTYARPSGIYMDQYDDSLGHDQIMDTSLLDHDHVGQHDESIDEDIYGIHTRDTIHPAASNFHNAHTQRYLPHEYSYSTVGTNRGSNVALVENRPDGLTQIDQSRGFRRLSNYSASRRSSGPSLAGAANGVFSSIRAVLSRRPNQDNTNGLQTASGEIDSAFLSADSGDEILDLTHGYSYTDNHGMYDGY